MPHQRPVAKRWQHVFENAPNKDSRIRIICLALSAAKSDESSCNGDEQMATTSTKKNARKPWHGFAIEIGPDTDLGGEGLLMSVML